MNLDFITNTHLLNIIAFFRKYDIYIRLGILIFIFISVYLLVLWMNIPFDITRPELFADWANNQGTSFAVTAFFINLLVILVPFLPNDPIHMAAGLVMPWWQALILLHLCSMIGWTVNYYLGKKLGAGFVHAVIGEKNSLALEKLVEKAKPKHFIFLAWTPGVSYDILGYIAGITNANYKGYFIGAFIGTIPTTLLSITYGALTRQFWWIAPLMLVVNIVAFLGLGSYVIFNNKGLNAEISAENI